MVWATGIPRACRLRNDHQGLANSHASDGSRHAMLIRSGGMSAGAGKADGACQGNCRYVPKLESVMTSEPTPRHTGSEKILVQETGAGLFQVQAKVGELAFLADEPVGSGGLGSGPTPYDLLGAALAACTVMTVRLYAERKGWVLDHISVRVGHERRTTEARDCFDIELMLEGALDPAQRAKLLDIANRCPVHSTLERGADMRIAAGGPVVDERVSVVHDLHTDHVLEICSRASVNAVG